MRVLLLENETKGVVNLREIKHFVLDKVESLEDIQRYLLSQNLQTYNFKYCSFEDGAFIPYFVKVKDGLGGVINQFTIERVCIDDLPYSDKKKLEVVRDIKGVESVKESQELKERIFILRCKSDLGEQVDDQLLELSEKYIKSVEAFTNLNLDDYRQMVI